MSTKGSITYDGIDVRDIKKDDLRHSIAVVLQDTHLFTGSIADNIRYGNPNATMEQVVAAAKLANAHFFISRLPDGYETVLTGGRCEPQPGPAAAHRDCARGGGQPAGADTR